MLEKLKNSTISSASVQGFTLIELLVTLSIIGILASFAVPSYQSFLINQQLSAAASDFLVSMMQARSEAIRQGKMVSVLPADGASWTSGWYIAVVNNTCVVTGTPFGVTAAPSANVTVVAANTNNSFAAASPHFTYGATGFPYSSCTAYAGIMSGTLAFTAVATGRESRIIVGISGRPKICDPSKETCTP